MKLILAPNPKLHQKAVQVADWEVITDFCKEMKDLLSTIPNGVALAANQVDKSIGNQVIPRIFVMDTGDGEMQEFVNPRIIEATHAVMKSEACLSYPKEGHKSVLRCERVGLEWYSSDGQPHKATFFGLHAQAIQHELDHLDGVTILDKPAVISWQYVPGGPFSPPSYLYGKR